MQQIYKLKKNYDYRTDNSVSYQYFLPNPRLNLIVMNMSSYFPYLYF